MNPASSTPSSPQPGYLASLWSALLGRNPSLAAPLPAAGPPEEGEAALRGRVSVLEADLAAAREKLGRVREEYARLKQEQERAVAGAGADRLRPVFKKLAPPLAILTTLAHKARAGEAVPAGDLAEAVLSLEKAFASAGLERIGEAGATVPYDAGLHARMSGGAANAGEPVVLQLPGYRLEGLVLHKAMVAVADKPGQGSREA